jgi:hypothetical protein
VSGDGYPSAETRLWVGTRLVCDVIIHYCRLVMKGVDLASFCDLRSLSDCSSRIPPTSATVPMQSYHEDDVHVLVMHPEGEAWLHGPGVLA